MGNLPFERTRYNPVRDVTPDEAEQDKRREAEQHAEQEAAGSQTRAGEQQIPAADSNDEAGQEQK
ncbi:hypothetical protein SAMN04488075_1474 [Paracoccus alkenifer]|uniref:Uncharacterized protein n=2 Tax=Paracoccus alkenifer TaxID=65735 RepID=A0A1H6LC28_9RHOB|nr:hypothetical protein SAMN04488075_1474 [Paracoccus alkenifer]